MTALHPAPQKEASATFCGEAKPEPADEDGAKVVPMRRRRAKAA